MKDILYKQFTQEEQEAIEGIVSSIIELIEPVVRIRVIQWMEVIKTTLKKKDNQCNKK